MGVTVVPEPDGFTTSELAAAAGNSVQQVRDLERLGVIPAAIRQPNGYRRFRTVHVTALRAYRRLAIAVGPVTARATLRDALDLPYMEAARSALEDRLRTIAARSEALLRAGADVVELLSA